MEGLRDGMDFWEVLLGFRGN